LRYEYKAKPIGGKSADLEIECAFRIIIKEPLEVCCGAKGFDLSDGRKQHNTMFQTRLEKIKGLKTMLSEQGA
jgi:hypothetical protein